VEDRSPALLRISPKLGSGPVSNLPFSLTWISGIDLSSALPVLRDYAFLSSLISKTPSAVAFPPRDSAGR
jgi:hypothetical protein